MITLAAVIANLGLASSLIASGGGPGSFSTVRAFDAMVGPSMVLAEQRQLTVLDGQTSADRFTSMFDYAINDAWQLAGKYNVKVPPPMQNGGPELAAQLVAAGHDAGGPFDCGTFLAQLFGVKIAAQMMADLDAKFGPGSSLAFARMTDQFFTSLQKPPG